MIAHSYRSLFATHLVAAVLSLLSCTLLPAKDTPGAITKEEVLKSLKEHSAVWEEKIKTIQPRLFFSDPQWSQVEKEIAAMPPERAANLKRFYEEMDKVVAAPLPVYLPPEQMVGKRGDTTTLYSAMEELWQREIGDQILSLSVAARLKPDGPYRTKLHDLVMAAIGFETWGRAKPPMGNDCDLAAGHLGRGIAVAYDWNRTLFSEAEREQIRKSVTERMNNLLAGLYGNAFWAKGFEENHNQVSVTGLAYCGIAFYDEIPQAPEWLAASRLDFIRVGDCASADGSSVEGVSYWAYGISFILQYIEGTRLILDSADLYQLPYFKNAAAFRLMASTPGLLGNVPWGDAVTKDWSYPHHIIYRLAAEYQDRDAAWFADHLPPPKGNVLDILWARNAPVGGSGPKNLDGRLSVNDLVASRSGWDQSDYLLSIKAGFTNRNHSHLDSGALGIAFGNEWVLIGPGYGKGAHEGGYWQSGGSRWTYFSNATESHSTLVINGKNQRFDREARSTITEYFSSSQYNWTSVDLTRAYEDVTSIQRDFLHRRGDYILVFDTIKAAAPVTAEWLAQMRQEAPAQKDGTLIALGKNGRVEINMLSPQSPFSLRQPTSPKVDNNGPQFSYEVKETGQDLHFLAILKPGKNAASPILATTESAKDGHYRLKISTDQWTDFVFRNSRAETVGYASADVWNRELATGGVRISGRLGVVRKMDGNLVSALALGSTELQLPEFSYKSATPCDLSVERDGEGWTVTASRDVRKDITTPSGMKLRYVPSPLALSVSHAAE